AATSGVDMVSPRVRTDERAAALSSAPPYLLQRGEMRIRIAPHRLASLASWLLVLGLSPGLLRSHLRPPPARPLRFACWYWHRPFQLSADEQRQLRQSRIERLYVYDGTVAAHDGELRLIRRQQWSPPTPC